MKAVYNESYTALVIEDVEVILKSFIVLFLLSRHLKNYISCFSVAVIKHHYQKQLPEERLYFSLWSQRDRVYYGKEPRQPEQEAI